MQYQKLVEADQKIKEREASRMEKMSRERHLPPLQKFEEGKYENVIYDFEKGRAHKRGVKLPTRVQLDKWRQRIKVRKEKERLKNKA